MDGRSDLRKARLHFPVERLVDVGQVEGLLGLGDLVEVEVGTAKAQPRERRIAFELAGLEEYVSGVLPSLPLQVDSTQSEIQGKCLGSVGFELDQFQEDLLAFKEALR